MCLLFEHEDNEYLVSGVQWWQLYSEGAVVGVVVVVVVLEWLARGREAGREASALSTPPSRRLYAGARTFS